MAKKTNPKFQNKNYTLNIVGAILVLLGLFSLTQSLTGIFGIFLANICRFFVGDFFIPLGIGLIILGGYLFVKGKFPAVQFKNLCGYLLLFIGIMLLFGAIFFSVDNIHSNFINVTLKNVSLDFSKGTISHSVYNGLIGSCLYSISYAIFSLVGTIIVALVTIIVGSILAFNIPLQFFINLARSIGKFFYDLFDHSKTEKTAKPLKKNTLKPEPSIQDVKPHNDRPKIDPVPVKEEKSEAPMMNFTSTTYPDYILPTEDELSPVKAVTPALSTEAIKYKEQVIVDTFRDFNIDVQIKGSQVGSSVTKIELEPPHGIKISRILSLSDNLALALANNGIRIEAPIPGKSLIGIEVPNEKPTPVYFRNVWEKFIKTRDPQKILEVPLGLDINGDVVATNLVKLPHLLIAGSTGSGKSVSINEILVSILMSARPDQVQMILVDPKKVELNIYNDIPHLLTPVVTDPKKAAGALNHAVTEMEHRYELFKDTGSRNITEYNEKILSESGDDSKIMPYILIVIDELSDLMMVAGSEVEAAIIRLAQLARAAGIHMIIATQRPSVDVITGLIKANIPSRIAFAVSSGVDSRTILDSTGAEKLIGQGDMLYDPMGGASPRRVQGAFISTKDVESITDFVKKEAKPQYNNSYNVSIDDVLDKKDASESEDPLFIEAVDIIYAKKAASSSMLQRYLKIGYNRAASLIDEMEAKGLVGSMNGSKPREVYLNKIDGYRLQHKETIDPEAGNSEKN